MTPLWIFPVYPLLLVGPLAAALVATQPAGTSDRALNIIVGGFIAQSVGYSLSLMIYGIYIYRLMGHRIPAVSSRPAMFVSVGPSGFTAQAVIVLGRSLPNVIPKTFMGEEGVLVGQITHILANWVGIWFWA